MSKKENLSEKWAEDCSKSNGTMVMLPPEVKDKAEEFTKRSDEYLAKAREFDKTMAEFETYAKTFWHEMRQAIEKSHPDVWSMNIGFNQRAKEDGLMVVNLTKNTGPMQV